MIKKIRDLSIRKKLTISYSVILVFPLIFLMLFSNAVIERFSLQIIGNLNAESIKDTAKVLNRLLDDVAFTLLNISSNEQMRGTLINSDDSVNGGISSIEKYNSQMTAANVLRSIPLSLMSFDSRITVLGKNQFEYANWENYTQYTGTMRQSGWYRRLIGSSSNHILWIGVKRSLDKSGDYLLEAAIPISSENNGISKLGVLHMSVNEKDFFNSLTSDNKNSEIYVIRNDGEILACSDKTKIMSNMGGRLNASKIIKNRGNWYIDKESDGEKVVVNSIQIYKTDWTLVSLIPYEKLIEPIVQVRQVLLAVNLIFMILFLAFTLFISSVISKPIIQLSKSMKKVEEGNFEGKIEVTGRDEVGRLSGNFNNMLDKVSELLRTTKEQEVLKREAEFEALQAQINPHFLFNTLSSIRWAAAASGDEKVEEMTHSLSVLLRSSINNGQDMVTIEEEITILRHFINLFQMKQETNYQFECSIEDSIMKYRIPHLLLQPIVENSILHGFEDMKDSGVIRIDAVVSGDVLCIRVADNGKGIRGISAEDVLKHQHPIDVKKYYKSVGLKNINDRIKLIYGEKYGLDISNGEERGTIVALNLPFRKE